MKPIYTLDCHRVHKTHTNECWIEIDIQRDLERIRDVNLECDGFSLKHAVKSMGMDAYLDEGDQNQPFFSEAYLYPLLGKEAARTVLAVIRNLERKLGVDRDLMP